MCGKRQVRLDIFRTFFFFFFVVVAVFEVMCWILALLAIHLLNPISQFSNAVLCFEKGSELILVVVLPHVFLSSCIVFVLFVDLQCFEDVCCLW